jgi:hypothetical protein
VTYLEFVIVVIIVGSFSIVIDRTITTKFRELNNKLNFLLEQSGQLYPPLHHVPSKVKRSVIKGDISKAKRELKRNYGISNEQIDLLIPQIIDEYKNEALKVYTIDK